MARTTALSASTMKNTPKGNRWRIARRTSPKTTGKALRPFLNSRERRPEFSEEFRSKPGPLAVVPGPRVEGVQLCLRPDREARHLPAAAETFLYAFDDLFPGTGFVGSPAVFGKAFFQERLLPVLQRDLASGRGDAIPKRLHVLDLIFDRQRVEPRRRQRQGVRHARNIPLGTGPAVALGVVYSAGNERAISEAIDA